MNKTLIYGIVNRGVFYSDNAEFKIKNVDDGIYSFDVSDDDFLNTIQPADIFQFESYIKSKPKMQTIIGYSFKKCEFIPTNFVKYQKLERFPLLITNENVVLDEWSVVKCLYIPLKKILFFLDYRFDAGYEILQTIKEYYEQSKPLSGLKQITPEMRFLYVLHNLERLRIEQELKRAKEQEFRKTVFGRAQTIIENSGGQFISLKSYQRGYEVIWKLGNQQINTLMNNNFSIIEAGFCLSGGDTKHTLNSITKLLGDYLDAGDSFSITRH